VVVSETHGHHWEPVVGRAAVGDRYHYAAYQYHGTPDYMATVDTTVAQEELYDLETDPYQLYNLSHDPAFDSVRSRARQQLQSWQRETGDPARSAYK
jgi:uncharacterized sulfatase